MGRGWGAGAWRDIGEHRGVSTPRWTSSPAASTTGSCCTPKSWGRRYRKEAPGKMDFELWKKSGDGDTRVMKRVRWRPEGCSQARGRRKCRYRAGRRVNRVRRTWQTWALIKSGVRGPGRVAPLVGVSYHAPEGCGFNPWPGWMEWVREATHWCFFHTSMSLSLSLLLLFSKKNQWKYPLVNIKKPQTTKKQQQQQNPNNSQMLSKERKNHCDLAHNAISKNTHTTICFY